MIASTMLPLKILKTKKRLSNTSWYLPAIVLAAMSLLVILSFTLRAISVAGIYGLIPVEIPVLSQPIKDPRFATFTETPVETLSESTPVVLLTQEAFIFGDLAAFSQGLAGVRNKFLVPHRDGAPDLHKLLEDMAAWMAKRTTEGADEPTGLLIFMPLAEIPAPIVIQSLSGFHGSSLFQRIILAGGIY